MHEDLEAYALGALDAERASQVLQHTSECRDCAAVVRAYKVAVDSLALTVPLYRASPRIKQRIMGGIGVLRLPSLSTLRRQWWAVGAAAVLLAIAIGGMSWAVVVSNQVSSLKKDNARLAELSELDAEQRQALLNLEDQLNSARNEQRRMSTTLDEQATLLIVALDPDLVPTELRGTSLAPGSTCSYVWSTKQAVGALTCKGLPQTSFSLSYELWAIKGDKSVALGSFLPRYDGTASMLVKFPSTSAGSVTTLWVTLEQISTSPSRPSEQIVLEPVPAQQAVR
jgi:anti-sigma-K factor RskA